MAMEIGEIAVEEIEVLAARRRGRRGLLELFFDLVVEWLDLDAGSAQSLDEGEILPRRATRASCSPAESWPRERARALACSSAAANVSVSSSMIRAAGSAS
jgi:hypothetical protein